MDIINLLSLPLLATLMGLALSLASRFFAVEKDPIVIRSAIFFPMVNVGNVAFPAVHRQL